MPPSLVRTEGWHWPIGDRGPVPMTRFEKARPGDSLADQAAEVQAVPQCGTGFTALRSSPNGRRQRSSLRPLPNAWGQTLTGRSALLLLVATLSFTFSIKEQLCPHHPSRTVAGSAAHCWSSPSLC